MPRLKDFPGSFWIANTMEIFERMAWYGFFAVSSLYITGSIAEGGLGFSDEDRGILQGVVTFFLYLFPVVSGALADRYGFKKMLFWSFLVLVPAYFFLGQFKSLYTFFLAFMLVALGNLFGGLLSGQMYAFFARDMQRPDLMWLIFALLALFTAVAIFFYDKFVIKRKL